MPRAQEFSVLAASGWVGSGWHLIALCDTRAEALRIEAAVYDPNARNIGHLTAVAGAVHPHPTSDFAYLVDTSRTQYPEYHLRNRRATVNASSWLTEGVGPASEVIARVSVPFASGKC